MKAIRSLCIALLLVTSLCFAKCTGLSGNSIQSQSGNSTKNKAGLMGRKVKLDFSVFCTLWAIPTNEYMGKSYGWKRGIYENWV